MWQGREALEPGFTLIVPTSAHLSVLKNAHLLGIPPTRIHVVPAGPDGAVDVAAFGAALEGCSSALVVLTLGTTMHGAYDDVAACIRLLNARWGGQWSAVPPSPARGSGGGSDSSDGGSVSSDGGGGGAGGATARLSGSFSGRRRLNYYLHLDCALGGLVLPFLRQAPAIGDGCFPPPRPVEAPAASGGEAPARPAPATALTAAAAALPPSACAPEWEPPAPRAPHGAAAVARHSRRGRHWRDRRRSGGGAAAAGSAPAAARATPGAAAPPTARGPAAATARACLTEEQLPPPDASMAFDFATPEVCSLTVSLHKQLGVGTVAAVFLSRAPFSARLSVFQEYIFSSDPTLLCSRDGHLALRAWLRLRGIGGWRGLSAMAHRAVDRSARLTERLCAAGVPAAVAPRGVCVRFPIDAVPDDTADALGVRRCCGTGHVFVMDSVPDAALAALADAMARKAAADKAAKEAPPVAAATAACALTAPAPVLLPALPAPVRAH